MYTTNSATPYEPPTIVLELALEVRAGSPYSIDPLGDPLDIYDAETESTEDSELP